jgi:hypothetical protein
MSRYIDADKFAERIKASPAFSIMGQDGYFLQEVVLDLLDKRSTADVVDVVRCKDCKHNPQNGGECDRSITHTGRDYVCEVNTYRYIGIDYCSYGERR